MKRLAIFIFLCLFSFSSIQTPHAASRAPLPAKHGVVASSSEIASRVGIEIMQKGGNAIDAAVAVALTLAVVWPSAGNIGGGGFMIVRKADGTAEAIDYRETAPLAASRKMYLDSQGNVIEDASTLGYKACGVPGTIAGLAYASQKYGKLEWKTLVEPARKLAAEGFPLDSITARELRLHQEPLGQFSESKRIFIRDGNFRQAGDLFIQPELANTLGRLEEQGPREFYEGQTATQIVNDMQKHGGLITAKDLKEYKVVSRIPMRGDYRGYEMITMPPPSSGGVALFEMLNMLESRDVRSLGFHSADHIHLLIETMKRAFADRAGLLGDPDFVKIPTTQLISKEYAREQAKKIDMKRATPSSEIHSGIKPVNESPDTTHFTIVDSEGIIVSNTYTLNDTFGSGVTIEGSGFLMNDTMDDFTSKPGVPNAYGLLQSESNSIAPRKRPLSSMTPLIVTKDAKAYFAIGTRGGPTIINSVLQVTSNIIDFGMNLQQAIDAPRFHHQWMPDSIYSEPFGLNPDARKLLDARGHKFSAKSYFDDTDYLGDMEGILVDPETGVFFGASDPRWGGATVSY